MELRPLMVFLALGGLVYGETDWTSQCDKCKCMWSNGRKNADCKGIGLYSIPNTLSTEIRDIDFSFNNFNKLHADTFRKANLHDIHKLKLQSCNIHNVDPTAFRSLRLMIELDLANNSISSLDQNVFRDNLKLRVLILNNNNLSTLEEGLFANMSHLQQVFLNNNRLKSVNSNVFGANPALTNIALGHNLIKFMDHDFIDNFNKLNSLSLEGNPWVCDCHLEKFRNASIAKNLVTTAIECNEPERVRGREWSDPSVIFACMPIILEPVPNKVVEVDSSNFTLTCKVTGSPRPDIDWKSNGRIVDRDPRQSIQKYSTTREINGNITISHLTIINVSYRDKGEYKCVAKNPGGEDERNISLVVRGDSGGVFGGNSPLGSDTMLVIILSIGAIVLLIVILILVICCCKKTSRNTAMLSKNRSINQSSEFINMEGHPEMQKALITDVNPVVKPPRQYSVPPSVTSGGTEVSEAKKMLIDDESIMAGDDESRSFDFDTRLPLKSPNHLDMDFRSEHLPYPPDLLSFPPRAVNQISPAGSSASTVADTTRLPAHHGPQSPLHSPLYDTSSLYRTLPYSRSQSPFTSPLGAPIRVPRQGGYVTIPRRPRQSWSASSEPPVSDIGEPLYDNLGVRSTASGHSLLSLNKIGNEATTPKGPRPSPYHPMTPVSLNCDPIAEHESPPMATTLPRSASAHRALSPTEAFRHNWGRSPEQVDSRRESTASLLPTPDGGKITKVPPRPPPKPKKRTSTGPLFEDEGEDGTEV